MWRRSNLAQTKYFLPRKSKQIKELKIITTKIPLFLSLHRHPATNKQLDKRICGKETLSCILTRSGACTSWWYTRSGVCTSWWCTKSAVCTSWWCTKSGICTRWCGGHFQDRKPWLGWWCLETGEERCHIYTVSFPELCWTLHKKLPDMHPRINSGCQRQVPLAALLSVKFDGNSRPRRHSATRMSWARMHKKGFTTLPVKEGAGIAQWLEHRTRDWKVSGSNPCWNGGRIFFSRVDFLCWLLFRYPFHPRVTTVARKKSRSFCQKCRWQVTAKHAYTLRMWILLNRASALVTACP